MHIVFNEHLKINPYYKTESSTKELVTTGILNIFENLFLKFLKNCPHSIYTFLAFQGPSGILAGWVKIDCLVQGRAFLPGTTCLPMPSL